MTVTQKVNVVTIPVNNPKLHPKELKAEFLKRTHVHLDSEQHYLQW